MPDKGLRGSDRPVTRVAVANALAQNGAVTLQQITARVVEGYNSQVADIENIPGHIGLKVDPRSSSYELAEVANRLATSILSTRGFLTVVQATKILIDMANRSPEESEKMAVELLAWMGIKYQIDGVRGKSTAKLRSVVRTIPDAFSRLKRTPHERWGPEIFSRVTTGGYGPLMEAFKDTPAEQTVQVVALSMLQYMNIRSLAAEVIREKFDVRDVTDEAIDRLLDSIELMTESRSKLDELERKFDSRMELIEAAQVILDNGQSDEAAEQAVLAQLNEQLNGLKEDRDEYSAVRKVVNESPQLIEQGRLAVICGVQIDKALEDHISELLNAAQQFKTLALLHLYQLALVYSSIVRELTRCLMARNRAAQMSIINDCRAKLSLIDQGRFAEVLATDDEVKKYLDEHEGVIEGTVAPSNDPTQDELLQKQMKDLGTSLDKLPQV